jgi:hypothetical protein
MTCAVPVSHWVALLKIQAPTERVSARAAGQAAPGIAPGRWRPPPVGAGTWGTPAPDGSTKREIFLCWLDAYDKVKEISGDPFAHSHLSLDRSYSVFPRRRGGGGRFLRVCSGYCSVNRYRASGPDCNHRPVPGCVFVCVASALADLMSP